MSCIGKVIRVSNGKNLKGTVLKTLIEETNPKVHSKGILEYILTYPPNFKIGALNNNSDSIGTTSKSTNTTRSDRPSGKKRSREESSRRNHPPSQRFRREEADSSASPPPSN